MMMMMMPRMRIVMMMMMMMVMTTTTTTMTKRSKGLWGVLFMDSQSKTQFFVLFYVLILSFFHGCSGTVCQRWKPLSEESKCDIEIVLKANHVLVTNEQRSRVMVTQELVRLGRTVNFLGTRWMCILVVCLYFVYFRFMFVLWVPPYLL
jgi:uncharacterized membrane protein